MDHPAITHDMSSQRASFNGPDLDSIGGSTGSQDPDPSLQIFHPNMFANGRSFNIFGGVFNNISGNQVNSTTGDVQLDFRNVHTALGLGSTHTFRNVSVSQPPAKSRADIEAMLDEKVAAQGRRLLWRESIVDLFKTLQLEYSLSRGRKLAGELGYDGDIFSEDTAKMNMWLHRWIMVQLVEGGGEIPAALKASGIGDNYSTRNVQCDFRNVDTALGTGAASTFRNDSVSPPPAKSKADIEAMLDKRVTAQGQRLIWRESIVDLLKTLQLESSLSRRRKLARDLGYDADVLPEDTAKMNIWLHRWIMVELMKSGGEVPVALKAAMSV